MRRFWIAAAVVFVLDQLSKLAILHVVNLDQKIAYDIWPPFLNLRMAWNYGVNFGLFSNGDGPQRWVLIAVALVISGWVVWWMRREKRPMAHVSGGLLVGGALGNVIDRFAYGAVADFLNMSCCGFSNPYSFNVADIAIFAGAVGLILFTGEPRKKRKNTS
ncbi:signal peptidase II [Psychromarinibacter sp. S121]|uniref:signal peptidase II n=1 Tax=Psychromarinibacter sp. S121 TaxID=3415127 RepID=UPI003C7EBDB2